MKTQNNHVQSQADNGNNGSFDYEAMIKGLISLCDDNELIISLDRNGVVTHIKETTKHELFQNNAELIGKCIWDYLPPETVESRKAVFLEALETGKAIRYEGAYNGRWIDSMVYPVFDKQGNVRQVIVMGRDITRSKQVEKELRRLNEGLEEIVERRTEELVDKAKKLEELNSALRVLLQKHDEEKREGEEYMSSAINQMITPYVRQIKQKSTDPEISSYINIIETNLNDLTLKFGIAIQSKALGLTPTEIEVALLIKAGKASKEIAHLLEISCETVGFHRNNIRYKLGIKNKKENLQSYLMAMGT